MMQYGLSHPSKHIATLQRSITTKVAATLALGSRPDLRLIARLRRIQNAAYRFGADRQTLQVIASGRRLLGDQQDLTPDVLRRTPTNLWLR